MTLKYRIVFPGISLILIALVAGCTLGPEYQRPEVIVPTEYREAAPWKEATPGDALNKGDWWQMFSDPVLDALQQRALAENQDLKVAIARVDQARAAARITESDLYPRVDLNPSAVRARGAAALNNGHAITATNLRVPFDLGYEIDLWGRVRRSVDASTAQYEASRAEMQNVMLTLQADVARNYFNLRSLDSQLDLLRRTVELRTKNLQLVTSLFDNGQVGRLDVATAETELANAQAETAALNRRRLSTEHALAVLVGEPVANFNLPLPPPNLEVRPPVIAAGLPSALLERRPDVAAAERQMIAANARIGIAKAAFFPAVSLTGTAGYASDQLSSLFDWDNRIWSLGPFISLPVFDAGRNRAQLDQAEAAWRESVALYRQQVLTAFREVEDALSDIRILAEQYAAQQRALTSARQAADLSGKRYRAGLVSYLEVVVNERTALAIELLTTQALEQRFQASVSLIKALGGGWQDPGTTVQR
ncbi:MAG: efflux transporter outer membrane subunit [Desulfuromonadales bacterium]